MAGKGEKERAASLDETPTWAIAAVFFVLIAISISIEHVLHFLVKLLVSKKRKALTQALHKVESELMLFGFVSLLLEVTKKPISKICVPLSVADTFLPCKHSELSSKIDEETQCKRQGKISLMSGEGVDQLQILIFVFAAFHVLSSLSTFGLGMAKMKRWKAWEDETRTVEYQVSNDPRRFKLIKQTTFGQRHLKFWSSRRLLRWPVSFLRQFTESVLKTDYLTLRHGFIMAHFTGDSEFNFQKFLRRTLDKDFQVVVGVSAWNWTFSVVFIFFNANGFHHHVWLPFIPLAMLLLVGTKLQGIITKMCIDSQNKAAVVTGTLLVKPDDRFFWFNRPKLLLHLMHFILFQNSFQLAFFAWTWYKFGLRSCYHKSTASIVIKIAVSLFVHFLCGYVTLPLYALVTQMGTTMKKAVFTEHVVVGLKNWHATAKAKVTGSNGMNLTVAPSAPSSSNITRNSSIEDYEIEMQPHDQPSRPTGHVSAEITEEKVRTDPLTPFKFW